MFYIVTFEFDINGEPSWSTIGCTGEYKADTVERAVYDWYKKEYEDAKINITIKDVTEVTKEEYDKAGESFLR